MRAGIKLSAMLPGLANKDLASKGVDLIQLTQTDIDELIFSIGRIPGEHQKQQR